MIQLAGLIEHLLWPNYSQKSVWLHLAYMIMASRIQFWLFWVRYWNQTLFPVLSFYPPLHNATRQWSHTFLCCAQAPRLSFIPLNFFVCCSFHLECSSCAIACLICTLKHFLYLLFLVKNNLFMSFSWHLFSTCVMVIFYYICLLY